MFIVQVIRDNVFSEFVHFGTDQAEAEQHFISACATEVSNWPEYTPGDIERILDDGYVTFGNGSVNLLDTDGPTSDDELAAMLGKYPPKSVDKITRWVESGEIGEVETIDEVLKLAGGCLDSACSWDICGSILFQAENGKWYTLNTEAVIAEAHPQYVKDTLQEIEDEREVEATD